MPTVRENSLSIPSSANNDIEKSLWLSWHAHRDVRAREDLITLYLPMTRKIAALLFSRRVNDEIEFADYHQLARVGLLEAIDRYDPSQGTQFSTYSGHRIRGMILSGMEVQTEKLQQICAAKRLQSQRLESIKQAAKIDAVGKEKNAENIFKHLAEIGIGLALSWMLEDASITEDVDAVYELPFYQSVELKQLQERVLILLKTLPEQEQKVIRYHYLQCIPFEEVASIMALSRGRISQIHRSALEKLKLKIRTENNCDFAC